MSYMNMCAYVSSGYSSESEDDSTSTSSGNESAVDADGADTSEDTCAGSPKSGSRGEFLGGLCIIVNYYMLV